MQQCVEEAGEPTQDSRSPSVWSECHEKEHKKQLEKYNKRKLEALQDGMLLKEEVTQEMLRKAEKERAANRQHDRTLKKQWLQKAGRVRKGEPLPLRAGMLAWIDPGLGAERVAGAAAVLTTHGLQLSEDRLSVRIGLFIVENPGRPGDRVKWVAATVGATVASYQGLMDENRQGPYITYQTACLRAMHIWMTESFSAKHPVLSGVIASAINLEQSKWRLLGSKTQLAGKRGACALRRQDEVVPGVPAKQLKTKDDFIHMIAKVAKEKSSQY